jgi:hypothetical protein
MKSILLGKYVDRLASLNDQLCFFQFNKNELDKRLLEFGPNVGKLFTPDVFAQNPMAPRINVKISELPTFQDLNQTFTFGAYFSTSYEVVSYYIEDSIDLLSVINSNTFQLTNDRQLEEKYKLTLASSNCTAIPIEIIQTLKYIRFRRNHFTHLSDGISNQFNTLITTSGITLNTFWSSAITSLDFTSLNVLKFEEGETIDLLKILRIIVQTLDENLASNFSHSGIAEFLANREFAKPQRINIDVISQRINKIQALGKIDFGISLTKPIVEHIVKTIGVK